MLTLSLDKKKGPLYRWASEADGSQAENWYQF